MNYLDYLGLLMPKNSSGAEIIEAQKGEPNGLASLNQNGKVPAQQLPSYVDDVLEFNGLNNFPLTGQSGKIYIDSSTGNTYRWSGSQYVLISYSNDENFITYTAVETVTNENIGEITIELNWSLQNGFQTLNTVTVVFPEEILNIDIDSDYSFSFGIQDRDKLTDGLYFTILKADILNNLTYVKNCSYELRFSGYSNVADWYLIATNNSSVTISGNNNNVSIVGQWSSLGNGDRTGSGNLLYSGQKEIEVKKPLSQIPVLTEQNIINGDNIFGFVSANNLNNTINSMISNVFNNLENAETTGM